MLVERVRPLIQITDSLNYSSVAAQFGSAGQRTVRFPWPTTPVSQSLGVDHALEGLGGPKEKSAVSRSAKARPSTSMATCL